MTTMKHVCTLVPTSREQRSRDQFVSLKFGYSLKLVTT